MQTIKISELKITIVGESADRICYVLYPFDGLGEWIEEAARTHGVSIAAITGMDWDNDLTPWPAAGQPPGSPDFRGNAPEFLTRLVTGVIPSVERRLNMSGDVERTLTGVSLSGLFALWQWMTCDTFHNIISLSGSFWYEGFVEWLTSGQVPEKSGKAYFLLGDLEPKTNVVAFRSVRSDTVRIVNYLHDHGIDDIFETVPGNHYQYARQRLDRAFAWMFRSDRRKS